MNLPKPKRQRSLAEKNFTKRLRYETLEPRLALAAEDLLDFVAQPTGSLTGKIVYTSAGHGWEYLSGSYTVNRSDVNEIVEPFGNQDQMTFFADYLLRAGATVAPMRPVGHQFNEVVLDNDSSGVTYTGTWSNSTASVFYDEDYGVVTDTVSYRFASISGTETATAIYTPDIPEAGFYPIYTWVADSSNRTNQLYRIQDSAGGLTEIRVDHRKVGKGWIYLGTYHFDEGTSGSVVVSNQSTAGGSVVIADTIRFGNGMGDLPNGPNGVGHPSGTTSGEPREDEASLHWTWRAIGQGNDAATVIGTSNISAPHRMAEHMNANTNPFGTSVYIGFHSNAGGGRGARGLINTTVSVQTPNQPELALYTGRQINLDMQALNGLYEHNWSTGTTHTFSSSFGEIDLGQSAEFDATIIEVAFHDSVEDANLMRDPKVRDQLGRSTYEAVIEYFDNFGGLSDTTSQPSAPVSVRAITDLSGDITVSWSPGVIGVQGGTPTAYRVYASRDGYGYLGYVEVAGAGAGSYTFDTADLDDEAYYFKVVAVNSGGESPRSAVAVASKQEVGEQRILIVDGFDRNSRSQNERYFFDPAPDNFTDRVRTRYNNSFDYAIQYGESILVDNTSIDTAQNEAVISGAVALSAYDVVLWISGEESSDDDTFNLTEQTLVANYLSGGGKLMVSGSEIAWDLDNLNNGLSFYNNSLRADYVSDDAGTYNVTGAAGSIFAGLSFSFDNGAHDNGEHFYDVNFPDRINPLGGSTSALTYVGGTGGGAGVQFDSGTGTMLVNLAFPFETITTAANRASVMDRVLDFFGVSAFVPTGDFDEDDDVDGRDFLAWQRGFGAASPTLADGDADGNGVVNSDDLVVWQTQYGTPPPVVALSALSATEGEAELSAEQLRGAAQFLTPSLVATESSRAGDLWLKDTATSEILPTSLPHKRQEAAYPQAHGESVASGTSIDRNKATDRAEFDLVFSELGKLL